jgi:DNA polymerase/3'-5' exonuclease PolX
VKQGNYFKAAKYATAIRSIASHTAPITSGQEAKIFPGVGGSIASTIQEIVDTVQFS